MLSKLTKYEFKYTLRFFPLCYFVTLAVAGVTRLLMYISSEWDAASELFSVLSVFSGITLFLLIMISAILPTVIFVYRFYKNMIGDEGYLTFTLPVKPWKHIVAKLIPSVVWTLIGYLVIAGSVGIIVSDYDVYTGLESLYNRAINTIQYYGVELDVAVLIIQAVILTVVSSASGMLMLYAGISIGQQFRGHRVIGSVAMCLALSFVFNVVSYLYMILLQLTLFKGYTDYPTPAMALGYFNSILFSMLLLSLISCVVFFFITQYSLTKKLNLE